MARLLCLYRYTRKWAAFQEATAMMTRAIQKAWPIIGILAGFIFVYTVVAIEIFGDVHTPNIYRRFDTFVSPHVLPPPCAQCCNIKRYTSNMKVIVVRFARCFIVAK